MAGTRVAGPRRSRDSASVVRVLRGALTITSIARLRARPPAVPT